MDPQQVLVVLCKLRKLGHLLLKLLYLCVLSILYRNQIVVQFISFVCSFCGSLEVYFKLFVLLPKLIGSVAVLLGFD